MTHSAHDIATAGSSPGRELPDLHVAVDANERAVDVVQ